MVAGTRNFTNKVSFVRVHTFESVPRSNSDSVIRLRLPYQEVLYSGKFSRCANFHVFHGMLVSTKIKTAKISTKEL